MGPLHVGHGRGMSTCEITAKFLSLQGYEVIREYYVNDAGRQIDLLLVSVFLQHIKKVVISLLMRKIIKMGVCLLIRVII